MEEEGERRLCLLEAQRLLEEVCAQEKNRARYYRRAKRAKKTDKDRVKREYKRSPKAEEGINVQEVLDQAAQSIPFFATFFLGHHISRDFGKFHLEIMELLRALSTKTLSSAHKQTQEHKPKGLEPNSIHPVDVLNDYAEVENLKNNPVVVTSSKNNHTEIPSKNTGKASPGAGLACSTPGLLVLDPDVSVSVVGSSLGGQRLATPVVTQPSELVTRSCDTPLSVTQECDTVTRPFSHEESGRTPYDTPCISSASLDAPACTTNKSQENTIIIGEKHEEKKGNDNATLGCVDWVGRDATQTCENERLTIPNFFSSSKSPEKRVNYIDRLVIAAPRGHAKSTIVSLVYVLWCICFKMERFILLVCDSEDQAKLHLDAVKAELEGNERLRFIFGEFVGGSWGEMVVEANGVRVQGRGSGQRIRGLKYRNSRPSLVICDDLLNEELVETEERRVKLKRWFLGALEPAVSRDFGKMIVIGTLLHQDDLLGELLVSSGWVSRVYDAEDYGGGILWPEMYSMEELGRIRESYEEKGELSLYYREYRNQIVSNEEAEFKREHFRYITFDEFSARAGKEAFRYFLTIDPAYKTGVKRDYSVFLVSAMDIGRRVYIVEIERGRFSQPVFFDKWFELYARYRPSKIGMQVQDWSRFFKPLTEDEMRKRGVFFTVTELATYSPNRAGLANKKSRISRMSKYYASGSVVHVKDGKNVKQLEAELLAHPYSKFDDIADCAGMLPDLLFPPVKKKERVYPQWLTEYRGDRVSGY